MIVVCPSCQSRYKFDESRLGERPKVKTRCSKCGGAIEIENPLLGAMTLPPGEGARSAPSPQAPAQDEKLKTQRSLSITPGIASRAQGEFGSATMTAQEMQRAGLLQLPRNKRFSLAVIQGAATGQIFQIDKPRTVIGRSGADLNVDDPEASRQHAAVEIMGETAILRDLGSTNGTFIDLDRIDQREIVNQQEFRIGSHVLMFIVTEVE